MHSPHSFNFVLQQAVRKTVGSLPKVQAWYAAHDDKTSKFLGAVAASIP
jgi:hypothetical protein